MQSKTKLIALLATLSIILAAIAVSMVFAFASLNHHVSSLIRVTYNCNASSVVADVSANKYFKTNEPIAFTGGVDGVVSFNEASSNNQSLSTNSTTLTGYYDYVIYEYIFENKSANTINVSLTASGWNNLIMFYTQPTTTQKTDIYSSFDENDYIEGGVIAATNILGNSTAYLYVAIKVERKASNASADFAQEFVWTIQDGSAI